MVQSTLYAWIKSPVGQYAAGGIRIDTVYQEGLLAWFCSGVVHLYYNECYCEGQAERDWESRDASVGSNNDFGPQALDSTNAHFGTTNDINDPFVGLEQHVQDGPRWGRGVAAATEEGD
jgi:hypothetical protein